MQVRGTYDHGRLTRLTIDIDPGDDPNGDLTGLLRTDDNGDRIGAFLRLYGDATGTLTTESEAELWYTVSRAGFVSEMARTRVEYAWLVLRDMYGWSYRRIAMATDAYEEERRHATIRRRVMELRRESAGLGIYFDADGKHLPDNLSAVTPEERAIACSIATYRDRTPRTGVVRFSLGWHSQDGDDAKVETPDYVVAEWYDADTPIAYERFDITY